MNYILEEIVKSNLFFAYQKDLVFQEKIDDKYFLFDYYSKERLPLKTYIDGVCKINGGYLLRTNHGNGCVIFNNTLSEIERIGFIIPPLSYLKNAIIYSGSTFNQVYGLYSFDTKNYKLSEFFYGYHILGDIEVGLKDGFLYCYQETEFKWKTYVYTPQKQTGYETQPPIKVTFIGVYKNELWIKLSTHQVLVYNTLNGELLFQIKDLAKSIGVEALATEEIHLDEKNAKIKFFAYKYYIEIDLITRKPEIKAFFGKDENDWFIGKSRFYEGDDNLYFIGRHNQALGIYSTGVFNTKTYTIDWYYDLKEEEYMPNFIHPPQVNDNHFGVLDSNDNLYLFKREETK